MKGAIAALWLLSAALAAPGEASEAVVVVQETRTPVVNTAFLLLSSLTAHLAERALRSGNRGTFHLLWAVTIALGVAFLVGTAVEFYDFFGKLLWVRTAVPVPSALGPGDTATLSLSTPALDAARQTRYRFAYGAGASLRGRRPP